MADIRKEAKIFGLPNLFFAARDAIELFKKRQAAPPPGSGVEIKPLARIYRALEADPSLPDGMLNRFIELHKHSHITVSTLPPVKLESNALVTDKKPQFLQMGGHYTTLRAAVDTGFIDLNQVESKIRQRDINLQLAREAADQQQRDEEWKKLYKK